MAGVITASEPSWIAPFTGLGPRQFGKLVTVLRREGADAVRKGHLVERWFAELTQKKLKRSIHRSVQALERDIRTWLADWNDHPRPFIWTDSRRDPRQIAAYCHESLVRIVSPLRVASLTPSSGQRSDSGRATKRASSSAAPRGRPATTASGNVVITLLSRAPRSGSKDQADAGAWTVGGSRSPS